MMRTLTVIAGYFLCAFGAAITLIIIPLTYLNSPAAFSVLDTGLPMFGKFGLLPFLAGLFLLKKSRPRSTG